VVTGFISRSNAGETVLLGRNGSDYSATQIGALAGVSASPSGATWPVFTALTRVK
jgi:aspartokinase